MGIRLLELAYARRNTRRLLAMGGHEVAPGHYPLIVSLHVAWFAAMALCIRPDHPASLWLLGLFAILQVMRAWAIHSLGPSWTTRIITVPGAPLVRTGPYRWLHHPNYLVVMGEIATLPAAFGAWRIALAFSLLNASVLAWRVHCEELALAARRHR